MRSWFVGRVVRAGRRAYAVDVLGREEGARVPVDDGVPEGSWVEVDRGRATQLAPAGSALAALYGVLEAHHLDLAFPPAVEEEVRAALASPGIDDPALADLEALPFVTIDGPGTRDLDQAVLVDEVEGGLRVLYAIADAAHYVRPGSALFGEGVRRGASYYLPRLSVPMLPRALSEGLISLNEGVLRRALVFEILLGADGEARETRLLRARVRSRRKLTFAEVQALHEDPSSSPLRDAPFARSLQLLREVGLARARSAEERDVVHFQRREVHVDLGGGGMVFVAVGDARLEVERWNEQVSILTNIEGGKLLAAGGRGQPIYRIHPSPQPARIAKLERFIDALIDAHHLDPSVWRRRSGEALADYLARLPVEGPTWRVRRALEHEVLITSEPSSFSPEPGVHYALAARPYARFTAPMREIVGVFTHKEALELAGLAPPAAEVADEALRAEVIERGNAAKSLQRALTKEANLLVIDQLLSADVASAAPPARVGTVMGVSPTKIYLQLDDPPIDLKVYLEDLPIAYALAPHGASLIAPGARPVRVGDAIAVRARERDAKLRRWRLDVAQERSGS